MFTQKTRKLISFICLILTFCTLVSNTVTALPDFQESNTDESVQSITSINKISDELQAVLDSMTDEETVWVYIWTTDIDYENVETEVKRKTGFNCDSFVADCDFEDLADLTDALMFSALTGRSAEYEPAEEQDAQRQAKVEQLEAEQNT